MVHTLSVGGTACDCRGLNERRRLHDTSTGTLAHHGRGKGALYTCLAQGLRCAHQAAPLGSIACRVRAALAFGYYDTGQRMLRTTIHGLFNANGHERVRILVGFGRPVNPSSGAPQRRENLNSDSQTFASGSFVSASVGESVIRGLASSSRRCSRAAEASVDYSGGPGCGTATLAEVRFFATARVPTRRTISGVGASRRPRAARNRFLSDVGYVHLPESV